MKRHPSSLLSTAAAALLVACGGGADNTTPTPTGTYNASAALHNLLVTGGSWTMSGSDNGTNYTVTIAFAPAASGPYPIGNIASSQAVETTTVASGGSSSSGAQTIYFNATTAAFIGLQASGLCSTATSNGAPLPSSAAIGAAGALFTENDLDGCTTSSNVVSTSSNVWTVVADTGIALFCWNVTETALTAAGSNGTESTCIQVANDGTLGTKARFSLTSGTTVNISARNF
jgi:hypothetical protein